MKGKVENMKGKYYAEGVSVNRSRVSATLKASASTEQGGCDIQNLKGPATLPQQTE
jgi:hypothetical protein